MGLKKFYSMKEVFFVLFSFIVIMDEKKVDKINEFEKKGMIVVVSAHSGLIFSNSPNLTYDVNDDSS